MGNRRNWSWEETLAAFTLYLELPPAKLDKKAPEVVCLAQALNRTPDAVAFKLMNLRANDPERRSKGMTHGSKLDQKVWEEYSADADGFAELAIHCLKELSPDNASHYDISSSPDQDDAVGSTRPVVSYARVNQTHFRNLLIENYDGRCCITGIGGKELYPLLVASHIKPWKCSTPKEKVSVSNGLLLNSFHDRVFDQGLITIGFDYRIIVSNRITHEEELEGWLWNYEGASIRKPLNRWPSKEFIEYHQDMIFRG